jgi:nicotinate phosphoribosyltransferase
MAHGAGKAGKELVRSPLLGDASSLLAAAAVVQAKLGDRRACAELSFDRLPADWGFLVLAGVGSLVQRLEQPWFGEADLAFVRNERALGPDIARALDGMECKIDLDSALEGSIVFPGEPVISAEGPLAQVLLVGALVESHVGIATEVATRAARLLDAAHGDEIVDATPGAPDPAASLQVARAAHVGGCAATTSALAAARLAIPLRAAIPDEVAGLCSAQTASPGRKGAGEWGDSVTDRQIDLSGEAMEVELALRRSAGERGTWLARSLDIANFLRSRWDLVALQEGRAWAPRLGVSQLDVSVLPGRKLVARYSDAVGRPVADVVQITSERMAPASRAVMIGPLGPASPVAIRGALSSSPLKVPHLRDGKLAGSLEPLATLRQRTLDSLEKLSPSYKRLRGPSHFPVGISPGLYELRAELFSRATER